MRSLKQAGVSHPAPSSRTNRRSRSPRSGRGCSTPATCWLPSPTARCAQPIRQPDQRTNVNGTVRPGDDQGSPAPRVVSAQRGGARQPGRRRLRPVRSARTPRDSSDNIFRISENGPLGRRFFSESRLQVRWTDSEIASADRAADDPRARRVHERRRAAVGRTARASTSRPRPIWTTSAARTRIAPASSSKADATGPTSSRTTSGPSRSPA